MRQLTYRSLFSSAQLPLPKANNQKSKDVNLFKIVYFICLMVGINLSKILGAQELPAGMLNYGIPRTALERVNQEIKNFTGSEVAGHFERYYDDIVRHIRKFSEINEDDTLLKLIHNARQEASNTAGGARVWNCTKQICGGHTLEEKHDSEDKAKTEGQKRHKEYANKEEIDSLQLYEVKQHGSKGVVATRAVASTAGVGFVAVGVVEVGAAIATGGMAIPFMLAWEVFAVGWTVGVAKTTIDEYNKIQYEMSLYYKHKESHLQDCNNKKYESFTKSTEALLKAIDSLEILVRIFKIESEITRLGKETPSLRTELQTLSVQLRALN